MTEQSPLFADYKPEDVSVEPADLTDAARRIAEAAGDRGLQAALAREERAAKGPYADLGGRVSKQTSSGDSHGGSPAPVSDPVERLASREEARAHIAAIRANRQNQGTSSN